MSTRRRQEQGGSNLGSKRNKKGTPVYSHEDIREQYCINDKELVALEASRRKPIFGCLTARATQPSPCRRKSLIGACFRTKGPSDENIYGQPPTITTSPSHRKEPIDYEDESYFKRRPKTICYTDPKKLASLDDSLVARLNSRPRLDTETSQYDNKSGSPAEAASSDAAKRPTQLALASEEFHSEEILKDSSDRSRESVTVQRSAFTQPNTPEKSHRKTFRNGGSSEANLDDKDQQKHVSFQQKTISRSATVGAIEDKACSPLEKEDCISTTGSKHKERLLEGPKSPEYYEQKALDSLLAPVLTKALLQGKASLESTIISLTRLSKSDLGTDDDTGIGILTDDDFTYNTSLDQSSDEELSQHMQEEEITEDENTSRDYGYMSNTSSLVRNQYKIEAENFHMRRAFIYDNIVAKTRMNWKGSDESSDITEPEIRSDRKKKLESCVASNVPRIEGKSNLTSLKVHSGDNFSASSYTALQPLVTTSSNFTSTAPIEVKEELQTTDTISDDDEDSYSGYQEDDESDGLDEKVEKNDDDSILNRTVTYDRNVVVIGLDSVEDIQTQSYDSQIFCDSNSFSNDLPDNKSIKRSYSFTDKQIDKRTSSVDQNNTFSSIKPQLLRRNSSSESTFSTAKTYKSTASLTLSTHSEAKYASDVVKLKKPSISSVPEKVDYINKNYKNDRNQLNNQEREKQLSLKKDPFDSLNVSKEEDSSFSSPGTLWVFSEEYAKKNIESLSCLSSKATTSYSEFNSSNSSDLSPKSIKFPFTGAALSYQRQMMDPIHKKSKYDKRIVDKKHHSAKPSVSLNKTEVIQYSKTPSLKLHIDQEFEHFDNSIEPKTQLPHSNYQTKSETPIESCKKRSGSSVSKKVSVEKESLYESKPNFKTRQKVQEKLWSSANKDSLASKYDIVHDKTDPFIIDKPSKATESHKNIPSKDETNSKDKSDISLKKKSLEKSAVGNVNSDGSSKIKQENKSKNRQSISVTKDKNSDISSDELSMIKKIYQSMKSGSKGLVKDNKIKKHLSKKKVDTSHAESSSTDYEKPVRKSKPVKSNTKVQILERVYEKEPVIEKPNHEGDKNITKTLNNQPKVKIKRGDKEKSKSSKPVARSSSVVSESSLKKRNKRAMKVEQTTQTSLEYEDCDNNVNYIVSKSKSADKVTFEEPQNKFRSKSADRSIKKGNKIREKLENMNYDDNVSIRSSQSSKKISFAKHNIYDTFKERVHTTYKNFQNHQDKKTNFDESESISSKETNCSLNKLFFPNKQGLKNVKKKLISDIKDDKFSFKSLSFSNLSKTYGSTPELHSNKDDDIKSVNSIKSSLKKQKNSYPEERSNTSELKKKAKKEKSKSAPASRANSLVRKPKVSQLTMSTQTSVSNDTVINVSSETKKTQMNKNLRSKSNCSESNLYVNIPEALKYINVTAPEEFFDINSKPIRKSRRPNKADKKISKSVRKKTLPTDSQVNIQPQRSIDNAREKNKVSQSSTLAFSQQCKRESTNLDIIEMEAGKSSTAVLSLPKMVPKIESQNTFQFSVSHTPPQQSIEQKTFGKDSNLDLYALTDAQKDYGSTYAPTLNTFSTRETEDKIKQALQKQESQSYIKERRTGTRSKLDQAFRKEKQNNPIDVYDSCDNELYSMNFSFKKNHEQLAKTKIDRDEVRKKESNYLPLSQTHEIIMENADKNDEEIRNRKAKSFLKVPSAEPNEICEFNIYCDDQLIPVSLSKSIEMELSDSLDCHNEEDSKAQTPVHKSTKENIMNTQMDIESNACLKFYKEEIPLPIIEPPTPFLNSSSNSIENEITDAISEPVEEYDRINFIAHENLKYSIEEAVDVVWDGEDENSKTLREISPDEETEEEDICYKASETDYKNYSHCEVERNEPINIDIPLCNEDSSFSASENVTDKKDDSISDSIFDMRGSTDKSAFEKIEEETDEEEDCADEELKNIISSGSISRHTSFSGCSSEKSYNASIKIENQMLCDYSCSKCRSNELDIVNPEEDQSHKSFMVFNNNEELNNSTIKKSIDDYNINETFNLETSFNSKSLRHELNPDPDCHEQAGNDNMECSINTDLILKSIPSYSKEPKSLEEEQAEESSYEDASSSDQEEVHKLSSCSTKGLNARKKFQRFQHATAIKCSKANKSRESFDRTSNALRNSIDEKAHKPRSLDENRSHKIKSKRDRSPLIRQDAIESLSFEIENELSKAIEEEQQRLPGDHRAVRSLQNIYQKIKLLSALKKKTENFNIEVGNSQTIKEQEKIVEDSICIQNTEQDKTKTSATKVQHTGIDKKVSSQKKKSNVREHNQEKYSDVKYPERYFYSNAKDKKKRYNRYLNYRDTNLKYYPDECRDYYNQYPDPFYGSKPYPTKSSASQYQYVYGEDWAQNLEEWVDYDNESKVDSYPTVKNKRRRRKRRTKKLKFQKEEKITNIVQQKDKPIEEGNLMSPVTGEVPSTGKTLVENREDFQKCDLPSSSSWKEKLKRTCMRTQATQTDTGQVRKSMPQLSLSPWNDKTEMVSQSAQTNGDNRRRLVKSLSEATHYDGFDYEIYDTDELPPPPPPPQHPVPFYMPMYPREHPDIWDYSPYHYRTIHNGKSANSVRSEEIDRCRCYSRPDSEDELLINSPSRGRRVLTKTMSEGEILQDKRKALGFASGYMEVDIDCDIHRKERIIEPLCVDEGSYDFSSSRIFSQESLVEDTDEDVFHEHFLCTTISRQSSDERRYSYPSDLDLKEFDPIEIERKDRMCSQHDRISPELPMRPKTIAPQSLNDRSLMFDASIDEISPVEISCLTDSLSFPESTDHLEESISESQVTVLQKLPTLSGSNLHQTSDSENGTYYMQDISSTATTPSTKHKSMFQGSSFDEELEDDPQKLRFTSVMCSSQLSSISDEQTSISENVMSDSSQVIISLSTAASEIDKSYDMPLDIGHTSDAQKNQYREKNLINSLDEQFTHKLAHDISEETTFKNEVRKLISPESDSSSSHFTEQDTSRSLASAHTNTITSRSDLSRTDSHPNTDHSETSEDYVTATENSSVCETTEIKRMYDEKHVSSPPRMDDIIEDESLLPNYSTSDSILKTLPGSRKESFNGTQNPVTSSVAQKTSLANVFAELEANNKLFQSLEEFQEKSNQTKDLISFDSLDEVDTTSNILDSKLSSLTISKAAKLLKDSRTGAIKKRYLSGSGHTHNDESLQYTKYLEDDSETREENAQFTKYLEEDIDESERRRPSLTEDQRERLKLGMKLEFPPGVTMFGKSVCWEADPEERELMMQTNINRPKRTMKVEFDQTSPTTSFRTVSHRHKPVDEDRNMIDNTEIPTTEVTTPGMVRSPAMHEGFRLEDWSIVRTPGTPEPFINTHSFDGSLNQTKIMTKTSKHEKKLERKKPKEEKPMAIEVKSEYNDYELALQQEDLLTDNPDRKKSNVTSSKITPVRDRFGPTASVLEVSIPRPNKSTTMSHLETRRRSGDVATMSWTRNSDERLRTNDHLLGPGDNLKKADSLRSFSPGSDNVFLGGSSEQIHDSRTHLCTQCGERPASQESGLRSPLSQTPGVNRRSYERELRVRSGSHRAKSEDRVSYTKDWGMTAISLELGDAPRNGGDDDERGLYTDAYLASPWLYVGPNDELLAWRRDALPPPFIPPHARISGFSYRETNYPEDVNDDGSRSGKESPDSTTSEKDFRTRYQAITHRMVHRKSSVEMYRRLMHGTFQLDKTVNVLRDAGEFGFRIHGSRPVVVSAIEAQTPAETSGLEVGDIVLSINEINVLDASHSEVVRLAHSGSDTLRLAVARTCDVLTPLVTNDPTPICAGYLYKLGGAHHPPGSSGISRNWHRRWFALKKDNCLYYYKSEVDQTPLGAVHLLNYSVHALADGGRQFAFTVAKFGGTTLHLAAKTEEARNRWGQVLTQAALQASQRDELIEESARRVQQSPGAIATPDCFGYLHKLGSRWHQWKRRYCVMKDACLYLYHDTDATNAIGVVHLHGYRVQSTNIGGKKHAFELIPPEPKFRHFYFCTDSDNDKKRWLAGLEYSIDRWIKVG